MQKKTRTSPTDKLFRAFSDRTRLRILSLLRTTASELCVCDIVAIIAAPQPTISRHLAYLRSAELVDARKDGLWMHYRLRSPASPFHAKLLDCLSCCFADVPELKRDARKLGKLRSSICCGGSCGS